MCPSVSILDGVPRGPWEREDVMSGTSPHKGTPVPDLKALQLHKHAIGRLKHLLFQALC